MLDGGDGIDTLWSVGDAPRHWSAAPRASSTPNMLPPASSSTPAMTTMSYLPGPAGSTIWLPVTIWAGTGADTLFDGGSGADMFYDMGGGNSTLMGGDGNDSIINMSGVRDTILGGAGDDLVFTYQSAEVDGGAGDDALFSYAVGPSTLLGGDGNDSLVAISAASTTILDGGAGRDNLFSGAGADSILGGAGDDTIFMLGSDINGNPVSIAGMYGTDTIVGGDGVDTIAALGHTLADTSFVNNGDGSFTVHLGATPSWSAISSDQHRHRSLRVVMRPQVPEWGYRQWRQPCSVCRLTVLRPPLRETRWFCDLAPGISIGGTAAVQPARPHSCPFRICNSCLPRCVRRPSCSVRLLPCIRGYRSTRCWRSSSSKYSTRSGFVSAGPPIYRSLATI
jgi:Ca2+-binding RTX toxin-like protein